MKFDFTNLNKISNLRIKDDRKLPDFSQADDRNMFDYSFDYGPTDTHLTFKLEPEIMVATPTLKTRSRARFAVCEGRPSGLLSCFLDSFSRFLIQNENVFKGCLKVDLGLESV